MNYEMYMRAAIAEASLAAEAGERADGAVAVLDEAMVAHGRRAVLATGDPTAHAIMLAIREAARRLGRSKLTGLLMFSTVEPCAMCAGALLQADADGIVFGLADPREGASLHHLGDQEGSARRLRIVSGILQDEIAEMRPDLRDGWSRS